MIHKTITRQKLFSTNIQMTQQVIRDLKVMVQAYHDAGVLVIIDLVSITILSLLLAPFQSSVPEITNLVWIHFTPSSMERVGNETASEHEMCFASIWLILLYWVQENIIYGFSVFLIWIHDVNTMQRWFQSSWMNDSNTLSSMEKGDMGEGLAPYDIRPRRTMPQMPNIGFFNMTMSAMLSKGEVFIAIKSGVFSVVLRQSQLAKAILGSRELGIYTHPNQVLNYVEAYDTITIFTILATLHPDQSSEQIMRKGSKLPQPWICIQGGWFLWKCQEFLVAPNWLRLVKSELTHDDSDRVRWIAIAPLTVYQVNWGTWLERQVSIEFIRQVIRLKTQKLVPFLTLAMIKFTIVFVCILRLNIAATLSMVHGKEHLLWVVNAKSEPYQFENAGNLAMLVTNSRSQKKIML